MDSTTTNSPDRKPMHRPLYVGIRPRLHLLSSHQAGAVYMYLLTRLDDRTGQCNPSLPTIAADLHLSEKTVRKALKAIEQSGVAQRQKRDGDSDNWSFAQLDIRNAVAQQPLPKSGTGTQKGYYPEVAGDPSPKVVPLPSPKRGDEETTRKETTKEEEREAASPPAGAVAPVSLSAPAPDDDVEAEEGNQPLRSAADDAKVKALTSTTAYCAYLLYGGKAVDAPLSEWAKLKPLYDHWSPRSRDPSTPEPDVSFAALGKFAAYSINWARAAAGEPLTPLNFGRLGRTAKTLCGPQGHMTRAAFVRHLACIASRWPEIRQALRWMDSPPALVEGVVSHPEVIKITTRLSNGEPPVEQKAATPLVSESKPMACRASGEEAMKILRDIAAQAERKAS